LAVIGYVSDIFSYKTALTSGKDMSKSVCRDNLPVRISQQSDPSGSRLINRNRRSSGFILAQAIHFLAGIIKRARRTTAILNMVGWFLPGPPEA
jgi:hypothetical protein